MVQPRHFFVATDGRTGSTAICDTLGQHDQITCWQEIFSSGGSGIKLKGHETLDDLKEIEKKLGSGIVTYSTFRELTPEKDRGEKSLHAYLDHLESTGAEKGARAIGFKLLHNHLSDWTKDDIYGVLARRGYAALHLLRLDLTRKGISGSVALATGQYNSTEARVMNEKVYVDTDQLGAFARAYARRARMLQVALEETGFDIKPITYEDFVEDRQAFAADVFGWLGLPDQEIGASVWKRMIPDDMGELIENMDEVSALLGRAVTVDGLIGPSAGTGQDTRDDPPSVAAFLDAQDLPADPPAPRVTTPARFGASKDVVLNDDRVDNAMRIALVERKAGFGKVAQQFAAFEDVSAAALSAHGALRGETPMAARPDLEKLLALATAHDLPWLWELAAMLVFAWEKAASRPGDDLPHYAEMIGKTSGLPGERLLRADRLGLDDLRHALWDDLRAGIPEFPGRFSAVVCLIRLFETRMDAPGAAGEYFARCWPQFTRAEMEQPHLLAGIQSGLACLGIAALTDHPQAARFLLDYPASTSLRHRRWVEMLASQANPLEDLRQAALEKIREWSAENPQSPGLIGPLLAQAKATDDMRAQEGLVARMARATGTPAAQDQRVTQLLMRDKYHQAAVVGNIAFAPPAVDDSLAADVALIVPLITRRWTDDDPDLPEAVATLKAAAARLRPIVENAPQAVLTASSGFADLARRVMLAAAQIEHRTTQPHALMNPAAQKVMSRVWAQAVTADMGDLYYTWQLRQQTLLLRTQDAAQLLRVQAAAPGLVTDLVRRGRCDLARALVAEAQRFVPNLPFVTLCRRMLADPDLPDTDDQLRLRWQDTEAWMAADARGWRGLLARLRGKDIGMRDQDDGPSGTYLVNTDAGTVEVPFRLRPWRTGLSRPQPLTLLDGEMVAVGDQLLEPSVSLFEWYPPQTPGFAGRNETHALYAPTQRHRTRPDPVIVLEHNDGARVANYFHQIILIFGRIAWLLEKNLLDGRKIAMPRGMPAWSDEVAGLVGLDPADVLEFDAEGAQPFSDARLMPAVDYLGPEAARILRARAWRGAGVDPDAAPTRRLLMTRRGMAGRRSLDEPALRHAALAAGYEEIRPETLSVTDQVRLFADARSVLAQAGASMTNTVFARAGTRVVGVSKREIYGFNFVELSVALDQPHRWLVGENLPCDMITGHVSATYHLAQDDIDAAVAWSVADGIEKELSHVA